MRVRMRAAALVLLVVMAVAAPGAQQPAQPGRPASGDTALRGRVFDARDGAALPRARIAVRAGDRQLAPVFADDQGRFALDVPEEPRYTLRVSKAGYATVAVPLEANDVARDVQLPLERGAAIEGRILDPSGAPAAAVMVGARREAPAGTSDTSAFLTETDDRGAFRIGGLPAGRYEVRVLRIEIPSISPDLQTDAWRQKVGGLVDGAFAEAPAATAPSFRVDVQPGDEVARDFIVPASPGPSCQPPRPPPADAAATSVIRGRVTAVGGGPLACASIRVMRPGTPVRTAVTDAEGRYVVQGLTAGAYALEANLAGYVPLQYGQTRARESGTTLTVASNDVLDRIDVALPRGSAIDGTVVDDAGEPMAGVSVRALDVRRLDGRTVATSARGARTRVTDDRGRYRLFGLLPGTYLVSASLDGEISGAASAQGYSYAPVYHPGTTDLLGAAPLQIDIGRDADAHLVFVPAPTARITGVALDSRGEPIHGSVMLSVSYRSRAPALEPRMARVEPDGSFVFTNVPYGDYVVQAIGGARPPAAAPAGPPGQPGALALRALPPFGMQYVSVVEPAPPPVSIRTSPGATIEGRIRLEGPAASPDTRVTLMAMPTDWDRSPMMGMGPVGFERRDDGTFSYAGLHGSVRIVAVNAPEDWYLRSVVIDGQDVTDRPFDVGSEETVFTGAEVVLSSEGAAIEGRATGARGEPVGNYAVVVFPLDRAYWFRTSRFLEMVRADQDGSFRVGGLPPGSYRVAAVDAIDGTPGSGEWQDPDVLEELSAGAQRVDLVEGARTTLTLNVMRR